MRMMITTITMTSRVFTKFMLSIVSMSCIQSLSVSLTPCDTQSQADCVPMSLSVSSSSHKNWCQEKCDFSFGFSLNFSEVVPSPSSPLLLSLDSFRASFLSSIFSSISCQLKTKVQYPRESVLIRVTYDCHTRLCFGKKMGRKRPNS